MKRRCHLSLDNTSNDDNCDDADKIGTKRKKIQSILSFPSTSSNSTTNITTCDTCGMSFYLYVNKDKEMHDKYHKKYQEGISWPLSLDKKVLLTFSLKREIATGKKNSPINNVKSEKKVFMGSIITIDKSSVKQVKKVEEVLSVVNQELNAPVDSKQWKDETMDTSKAFLLLIDNKVIGVCSTDKITNTELQCRWMIFRSQVVVPKQINHHIKVGISRIWIAPTWRGLKLSFKLLDSVLKYSIYGITLSKNQIGFSQPSHSGSLLAKSFNGVRHKSGEILIPIYLE